MLSALVLTIAAAGASAAPVTDAGTPDQGKATLAIKPEDLEIATFFDGTAIEVSGEVAPDTEIAVLLEGSERAVDLSIKGKVWGFLWMNVGEIRFERVPGAYLLASRVKICDLAPYPVRKPLGLGLDALEASVVDDRGSEPEHLFGELIELKQRERLYGSLEDAVRIAPIGGGRLAYVATIPLPARIPEDTYQVSLWGFRDGGAAKLAQTDFVVKEVGATHAVAELAAKHGTLYGVLALVIALAVGLTTGMVFGLGGKGGH
jgi:uncharacterized protein (TIGR02186 family)